MHIAFGKKKQMGRTFLPDGAMVPYTVVELLPAHVVQVKTVSKDGYSAVKLAVGSRYKKSKSVAGQIKAAGRTTADRILEIRLKADADVALGSALDTSMLETGKEINVIGNSKGRGFQGVVRRHHFHGHPASHGHKDQLRMPGSIGAGGVQHVFKGMRMAGHMGTQSVTVKNLEIIEINAEEGTVLVKGALPGAFNGFITIAMPSVKELKFVSTDSAAAPVIAEAEETAAEEVTEETVVEETPVAESETVEVAEEATPSTEANESEKTAQ